MTGVDRILLEDLDLELHVDSLSPSTSVSSCRLDRRTDSLAEDLLGSRSAVFVILLPRIDDRRRDLAR